MSSTNGSQYLISYKNLRSIIGALGVLLFVVPLIYGFTQPKLLESISASYYTPVRNVFVGALCVLGMFLIAYRGYDLLDTVITNVAGVCTILVAFCPTARPAPAPQTFVNHIHPIAASAAFVLLAVMALQFTQSAATDNSMGAVLRRLGAAAIYRFPRTDDPARNGENITYVTCAWIIVLSIGVALASVIPLFWPEAFMLTAFGLSWTVKGGTLPRAQQALKRAVATPQSAQA